MKKLSTIMLCVLILVATAIICACTVYNYNISAVSSSEETKEVTIASGSSSSQIAEQLEQEGLIRSKTFFLIYLKIFQVNDLKAGVYTLSPSMNVETIVDTLTAGNNYNPNEIRIQFREGITMREVARLIASNTNHTEDEVFALLEDETYLDSLIEEYWFLTDAIKDSEIYYSLEGYLFPDTYNFASKDVSIETIFATMLDEMEQVLEPYRSDIEASRFSVHELLTLASMAEKEGIGNDCADEETGNDRADEETCNDRANIVSVFINRIDSNMSLGSDVTTRYALRIDDATQALTAAQYQTQSPYNTRLIDGSMNGKLPVGPICTVSKSSIEAAIHPTETDYLYFIANIQLAQTFFFDNSQDFEAKKLELQDINQGR